MTNEKKLIGVRCNGIVWLIQTTKHFCEWFMLDNSEKEKSMLRIFFATMAGYFIIGITGDYIAAREAGGWQELMDISQQCQTDFYERFFDNPIQYYVDEFTSYPVRWKHGIEYMTSNNK